MVRLEDIAKLAGVSRTTVSNVIHGNTKRVSLQTIDKVNRIIKEQGYLPNMASQILSGSSSRIIGVVLGYGETHGMLAMQDPFVGEFLGTLKAETEKSGYFVMLTGGEDEQKVVESASQWNVEGLIILGYSEEKYERLRKKLNRKMVLVDTYAKENYRFYNVGVDDYSGGRQIGAYLYKQGFRQAVYVAETREGADYQRWLGFKKEMECEGRYCSKSRYFLAPHQKELRLKKYREWMPLFLQAGAVAFSCDYAAVEAMNFLKDQGIAIPEQLSVTGFDDNLFAKMCRPQLTTVHQDVQKKAKLAVTCLLSQIEGEEPMEKNIRDQVQLIIRDSVKERS